MSKNSSDSFDGIEQQSLAEFTEQAYLNYAMYVIMDRALPHIGDGLKPVQRRILYAMSELGLKSVAKFKKSARTVGDVLGKFHPHGDSACYEAMVLMAQPFSYRYPLVFGQGNWGSADDPKSFAAMRYTEAKLTRYADCLLAELGQGTSEWQANFDGTLQEPVLLPARLPNVLLNGSTGIAVGMATDIPPHNIGEVVSACIHLLEHPRATLEEIMAFIPAPDFPTKAEIITPAADLLALYRSGRGSVRQRAVWRDEHGEIVIHHLPYQVSGAKILEQIASQMRAKKLPMVADLRDESDHENPTRLVIVPRSNRVDAEQVMGHLFATTDLERSYRINLNMIGTDGLPQVKNLLGLLKEWLEFRIRTVRRRLQYRLDKVLARLHVLEGLLMAFLNIDQVIHIVRTEDAPKAVLMAHFGLSNQQAESILELKLRHLAKLEEIKIRGEQGLLLEERDSLQRILGSDKRLKTLVRKELKADGKTYGDARRSPLVERHEAKALSERDLLPSEAITVVLSAKGWVRAGKGHEIDGAGLAYKSGDEFLMQTCGRSNQAAQFLDSSGRSFSLPSHSLPTARGHGEPLTGRLNPLAGSHFISVNMGDDAQLLLMTTDAGYGFVTQLGEMASRNKNGKALISVPSGARVLPPVVISDYENQRIAAVTSEGRLLIFALTELPKLSKGKGNKIISIPSSRVQTREEFVVAVTVLGKDEALTIYAGKRHLTLKNDDLEHYLGERGRRGAKLPRGLQRVDGLAADG